VGEATVKEIYNFEDPSAEVTDYIFWDFRQPIIFGLLGGWQSVGGWLTYIPPATYNDLPGLVCKSVSVEPLYDYNSLGQWSTARITVSWAKPENQTFDFGELSFDVGAEALSLPNTMGFTWASGPDNGSKLKDTDVTPQAIIPTTTIALKRKSPFLFLSAIGQCIGRINSVPLGVAGTAFPAEYVLFAGAKISRKFTSDANDIWQYDFAFMAKPFSWNKFAHKSGTLQYISPPIYQGADFNFFFN
jgi:hypothetical protein